MPMGYATTLEDRILLIAPYPGLQDVAKACRSVDGYSVQTAVGDLGEGVEIAKAAEDSGCEVIISRGGTADVIRAHVSIPVVEIKVTGYDVLRVLHPAFSAGRQVAVVGYSNVVQGARSISTTLGVPVGLFLVEQPDDAERLIKSARDWGADLIVGDVVSTRTARDRGFDVKLIVSGEEAVQYAIDEAFELLRHTRSERDQKQKLKAILDYSHEGIVSVDRFGNIEFLNPAAEALYGVHASDVIGLPAHEALSDTPLPTVVKNGIPELDKIRHVKISRIISHTVPIVFRDEVHGAVEIIQDVTRIQNLERRIRTELHRKGLIAKYTFEDVVAESRAMQHAINVARGFAGMGSNVLLYGETGTGKELFAQSIHNAGEAAPGPFVAVNCAALPGSLLESELFGYADGAFTGARKGGKQGLFELAHNGTIFLDEVAEMDLPLQARFLRVLQEREVMRVGGDTVIPVHVRIIAATNQNLREQVAGRHFRQDLYYRLKVLDLTIPPLRERREDIIPLMKRFFRNFSQLHGLEPPQLSDSVCEALTRYHWPGNVRELENLTEKIIAVSIGAGEISEQKIREQLALEELDYPVQERRSVLKDRETEHILQILREEHFNQSRAALRLGIDRGTLRRKLKNIHRMQQNTPHI